MGRLPSDTGVAIGVGKSGPPGVGVQVGGKTKPSLAGKTKPWVAAIATIWGGRERGDRRGIKRKIIMQAKREAKTSAANKNHCSTVRFFYFF